MTLNRYTIQSLQMEGVEKTNMLLPLPMHGNVSEADGIVGVDVLAPLGLK